MTHIDVRRASLLPPALTAERFLDYQSVAMYFVSMKASIPS